jgi:hypothetical protein
MLLLVGARGNIRRADLLARVGHQEEIGVPRAPDKMAAAVEANKEFMTLTDHERARLVIEEQPSVARAAP